ncbi:MULTISPECIES: hypothetical protein [unclassified Microbacterium]|uniref:hypothetical protein n=1 Tax=unclassified Microbacterium TaxID=2609290 RepID=UPI0030105380
MTKDFDWMVLISKRAALKEQFPPLRKVLNERPGCAADIERKRIFREAAVMKRAEADMARRRAALVEAERRRERAANRRRAAEYKALQAQKREGAA